MLERLPELANWAAANLDEAEKDPDSGLLAEILGVTRFATGSRLAKLKLWRKSLTPDAADRELAAIKEQKPASRTTQRWKNYRTLRLNQTLNLGQQLAKVSAVMLVFGPGAKPSYPKTAHENAFNTTSPLVQQLWAQFQSNADLRQLFPEITDIETFWHTCCRTMAALGYQSDGTRIRVQSDSPQSNGKDRNGKAVWVFSRTTYFAAWRVMTDSGSEAFQSKFEDICSGIDNWIGRDQQRADEYRKNREAWREAAA